jgi:nucleoside-diphosphate-sugar epimerase
MKKVLITGAGGYIGTHLVKQFLHAGWKVIALDRFFFGVNRLAESILSPNLKLVNKDIRDVQIADFSHVDVVIDLAALSNDPTGDLAPELTNSINHLGRVHVAKCAKKAGVKRYILASSCSVYGQGGNKKLGENAKTNPLTVYARANVDAEKGTLALADKQFCVSALRFSTVFGLSARMRFDLVINIMTLNAIKKGKLFVFGGEQWRPLVHVADAARALHFIASSPKGEVNSQVYNVGSGNYQIIDLAKIVLRNIPAEFDVKVDDVDKRDYKASFDKIRCLGFKTKYSIDSGIRQIQQAIQCGALTDDPSTYTVNWYKKILAEESMNIEWLYA